MPSKRRNELTAGIFVMASLAIAVGVVIWLGASKLFQPPAHEAVFGADLSFGSAGLAEGNFVQVGDKVVGQIKEIRFDPKAKLTLDQKEGKAPPGGTVYIAEISDGSVQVHSDGSAVVATGLVGQGKLVITSLGTTTQPAADAGHPVRIAGGLDRAMADIGDTAKRLREIAEVVQKELSPDEAGAILGKIRAVVSDLCKAMANVKTAAADINDMTADAKPKVSKALSAVADTAEKIKQYTDKDIGDILAKLRDVNTDVLKIARDLQAVAAQAKEVVLVNRESVDEIVDNMNQVSANLKSASKEIRRNPWRLFYKPDEKEVQSTNVYDAARAFSNGAEQLDQAMVKLTGLSKAYPDGIPADNEELKRIREHIKESFEKFNKAEQALWKELTKP